MSPIDPKDSRDYQRIEDRLRDLELQTQRNSSHIESEIGNLARLMSDIRDMMKKHDVLFFGADGSAGLVTRLDRLEQIEESRRWIYKGAIGTAIGLVVKVVWDIVMTHK